jgi:S-adenosylmethionine:tRNA ribosyltransferase-isomerase
MIHGLSSFFNESFMKTAEFDYFLPEALIAQEPCAQRDASRLLFLSRQGALEHRRFGDLPLILRAGDRLVFNDTKVFPARLHVHKQTGAKFELLFTKEYDEFTWSVIAHNTGKLPVATNLIIDRNHDISLKVIEIKEDGSRVVMCDQKIESLLDRYGDIPLPPYITRAPHSSDRDRYQTIYAQKTGAIAAPTAGLHFTPALLDNLEKCGVDTSFVTLHVGIGTFRPVKEADPANHIMHSETYDLPHETVSQITETRKQGGRIIAVGTTVVRVLEHCIDHEGVLQAGTGSTTLKILPGYRFRTVDGIITNFHLPCSTLLMLVSAFAGREPVLAAYDEAVAQKYRFFSYGDAMMII